MPVYDYKYKTWEGKRRGPLLRLMAIPKFTYKEFLSKRAFVASFTLSWVGFLLAVCYIYLLANPSLLEYFGAGMVELPPINEGVFKRLLDVQLMFCFFFAFQIGSGLIAQDLEHNATVLYLCKPVSRWEFFFGKFLTLFMLFMLITWVQGILLFLLQTAAVAEDSIWRQNFFKDYAWIALAITEYSVLICATLSLMILAASSLTKNKRYAGTIFVVYGIGSGVVARLMANHLMESPKWLMVSILASGKELGQVLFHAPAFTRVFKGGWALTGVLVVWMMCGAIIKWRLDRAARYGR